MVHGHCAQDIQFGCLMYARERFGMTLCTFLNVLF